MMVSPYEQERSCSSFHLFRFSSDQMCVATESPFSYGFDQTTCSIHKVYCLNHTIPSHNSSFFSQKHLNKHAMSFLCYLGLVFIASISAICSLSPRHAPIRQLCSRN